MGCQSGLITYPTHPAEHGGGFHTSTSCVVQPTPNELDPVCQKFFQFTLDSKMGGDRAVLLDNVYAVEDEGGNVHRCYPRQSRGEKSLGWCGTCVQDAVPGEPGR